MPQNEDDAGNGEISLHERIDWLAPVLSAVVERYREQHGLMSPTAAGDRLFSALIEECEREASRSARASVRATDQSIKTLSAEIEERLGPNPVAAVQKGPIKSPSSIASKWSVTNRYSGRLGGWRAEFQVDGRLYWATMMWSYTKSDGGAFSMEWRVYNAEDGIELTVPGEPGWLFGVVPGAGQAAEVASDIKQLLAELSSLPVRAQRNVVLVWRATIVAVRETVKGSRLVRKAATNGAKTALIVILVAGLAFGASRLFPNSAFAAAIDSLFAKREKYNISHSLFANGECENDIPVITVIWGQPLTRPPRFETVQLFRDGVPIAPVSGRSEYRDTNIQPGRQYQYRLGVTNLLGRVTVQDDNVVSATATCDDRPTREHVSVHPEKGTWETAFTFTAAPPRQDGDPLSYEWNWQGSDASGGRSYTNWTLPTVHPVFTTRFSPNDGCGYVGVSPEGFPLHDCYVEVEVLFKNGTRKRYRSPAVHVEDSRSDILGTDHPGD